MTTINEIFRTFGPEYLERYSQVICASVVGSDQAK